MRLVWFFLISMFPVVVLAQTGQVSVRVTDSSTGIVITNAEVHADFNTSIKSGWGWGGGKPNRQICHTDTNGICTLTGNGDGSSVGIAAFKDGYYGSAGYSVQFTNTMGAVQKKWQPWNPVVDIALKRIGAPVPLYAKCVWQEPVPATGKPLGFDLKVGDWVKPHGQGLHTDLSFIFSAEVVRTYTNWFGTLPRIHETSDCTLIVSFPEVGDGIIPVFVDSRAGTSALRLPALAPRNGYVQNIKKRVVDGKNGYCSDIRDDANYFFRVRTEKDEEGNIVSALYGKIHGDFRFEPHVRKLTFVYYLNPEPNDRNVEFDPQRNLFKTLSSQEEVREP